MNIKRIKPILTADHSKVILRRRRLSGSLSDFIERFRALSDDVVAKEWAATQKLFEHRHRDFELRVMSFAHDAEQELNVTLEMTDVRRKLLGAYLSMEYTIEAAALFNPSIVPHFDQHGDGLSFIMSLRAVGEGHISSIEFLEGRLLAEGIVDLTDDINWRTLPRVTEITPNLYTAEFEEQIPIRERVLFPQTATESNGMEDLRLVQFTHAGGETEYLGTYTAYDGRRIQSKLLRTGDFRSFDVHNLSGDAIQGKGIAFFPRKINGKYFAIGRQDGYSLTVMQSDSITRWDSHDPLMLPTHSHDLTQLGNCGSPIETEAGWLLPTHGVGPVRRYSLGVALLDLEDPSEVIGYLPYPFMEPNETEREGYVPNVLYTCGWLAHGNQLLIPYAMSDTSCGFAVCNIAEIIEQLKTQ